MRYVWFSLCIIFGLLVGLIAGSRLIPLPYENLHYADLRSDYKTDYVLMVAEIYGTDHNLPRAMDSLSQVTGQAPVHQVQQAIVTAQDLNYSQQDLQRMIQFLQAVQTITPTPGSGSKP